VTEAVESKGAEAGRQLVLGFDAGCGTCGDLAQRIHERVGDKLAVRNLRDPEVEGWREEALGKAAPWAPTLFEVEPGGRVKAWVGMSMGLALGRRLGARDTWQVMQALGEMEQAARIEESAVVSRLPEKAREAVAGISRGQFLKGVGGAAVAATVLAGGPLASSAGAATETSPYDIVKGRRIVGAELVRASQQVGSSVDVKNLVGLALSTPTKVSAAKPVGFMHTLRNGTAQRVLVYSLSDGRRVTTLEYAAPPKGVAASRAMLWRSNGSNFVMTKASEGGALWRVEAGSLPRTSGSAVRALGECPPVGNQPGPCWVPSERCVEWVSPDSCRESTAGAGFGSALCASAVGSTLAPKPPPAFFVGLGIAGACGLAGYSMGTSTQSCGCVRYCKVWIRMNGYMGC
jgi:hypothetical protein